MRHVLFRISRSSTGQYFKFADLHVIYLLPAASRTCPIPHTQTRPTTMSSETTVHGCSNETPLNSNLIHQYEEPDDDLESKIAIYPDLTEVNDEKDENDRAWAYEADDYDNYEDRIDSEYIKPIFGIRLVDNNDLWAHLRKDKQKRWQHDNDGPLPAPPEFDEEQELVDFKTIRDIVRADGGEGAALAAVSYSDERVHVRSADGTRTIVAKMLDALHKKYMRRAAVIDKTDTNAFVDLAWNKARATRGDHPHLSQEQEAKLNAGCHERYRD